MGDENLQPTTAKTEKELIAEFQQLIEAKAEQISARLAGVKVHAFFFKDPESGDLLAGYLQEPNRVTKLRFMDRLLQGPMIASSELLDVCLLKEDSDPRLYSEKPEHDIFYIGACTAARDIIKQSVDLFKKK
jgi:hypothetical protein